MYNDVEKISFEDVKKQINTKFIDQDWITVFSRNFEDDFNSSGLCSAIVDIDKVGKSLQDCKLEMIECDRPGLTEYYKGGEKYREEYHRFSVEGFEPLIYRREFGRKDGYLELSEEFRLYHNLYEIYNSPDKREYLYFNSNGDEEIVAKVDKNEVLIKLRFLKDYISVRKKHLFIDFYFIRFSKKTIKELGISEINENSSSEEYFYNHTIDEDTYLPDWKTRSWINGKVLIKSIKDYRPNIEENDKFEEFIIGCDENGKFISFSCDEKKLGNDFGENPDAPQYVTPVFFSKDVLKKYYDNPSRYLVEDCHISCEGARSIRLDNNCDDYVIVLLGDLGNLHHKEQLYWKSFNISPRKEGFSVTGYKRFVAGEFCDPVKADFYLKMRLEQFNELWIKKYNWHLFKSLSKEDSHYLEALHLLTSQDNRKEFDEQILALTKIFIDSLNEKELVKQINLDSTKIKDIKGISKFELFLKNNNVRIPDMIELLRNLQDLRSSTVAHRRSEKLNKKISSYFKLDEKKLDEILKDVFVKLIQIIDVIEKHLLLN
ncbi:MAG: hypothetical protein LE169_02565 [Endomicrobium sp.]|nr:hypothetical protein [Endomicrobium sp.]